MRVWRRRRKNNLNRAKTSVSNTWKRWVQDAGKMMGQMPAVWQLCNTMSLKCTLCASIVKIACTLVASSGALKTSPKTSTISAKTWLLIQPDFLRHNCIFGGRHEHISKYCAQLQTASAMSKIWGSLGCSWVSSHTIATKVMALRCCPLLVRRLQEDAARPLPRLNSKPFCGS